MYDYFHGFSSNIGCTDKVLKLIGSLKINELPSDKNIKGWQQGLDGITYFIEYKVDKNYSFKNYWTPTSQDSLAEAQLLLLLISSFESLPDIKNSSKDFQNEIPFDSWIYPGSSTSVLRIKPNTKKKNGGYQKLPMCNWGSLKQSSAVHIQG
mgnify:CR=1 FL=1